MLLNKLERRVIEISHKKRLSHLSSCLTAVPLIDAIYQVKEPDEPFILGNGHAALALYTVLEKNGLGNAEELFDKHGVHPNRDMEHGIWASTGSLGQGEPIAVGMALANRERKVYLMTSDGACAEGSVWEALRIAAENRLENLRVTVCANGTGAYGKIDVDWLDARLIATYPVLVQKTDMFKYPDYLQGENGHYHTLTDEQYKDLMDETKR